MLVAAFALLLILALIALFAGRRRLAIACALLLVLGLFGFGCGPLSGLMLQPLQHGYGARAESPPWQARNAIVVLGAGTVEAPHDQLEPRLFAYGRLAEAWALYRQCVAPARSCKVLVSGGNPQHNAQAEAVVYAAELRRLGVPAADLIVERASNSTWQNAQFSRPLLDAYAPQQLLLLTSGFHMRRSLQYFAHFGMHPIAVAGDYVRPNTSWLPQAWNLALADMAVHEWLGIARFYVYEALGWNAPALPPLRT